MRGEGRGEGRGRDEIFHCGENGKGEDFRFYFWIVDIRFSEVEIFHLEWLRKKSLSCYPRFTCGGNFAIDCSYGGIANIVQE